MFKKINIISILSIILIITSCAMLIGNNSQSKNNFNPSVNTTSYNLSVNEIGLPTNTYWAITFNGTNYSSDNSVMYFSLQNGSYTLYVNDINGYSVNYSSVVQVNGNNNFTYIIFSEIYYRVDFKIFGLPANTSWAILVNNTEYITNATSINIYLQSGIYNPIIIIPNGYNLNNVGTLRVSGNQTSYYIQIANSPFNFITQNMSYIFVFIFIMMIFLIAIIIRRGNRE